MNKKIDLQAVVSEHYAAVYRFGYALARNASDSADLTQEAFLMLAMHHSRLREPEKVKGCLFTTLRREFLRRLQSRTLHQEVPLYAEQHDIPTTGIDAPHRVDAKLVLEELANVDERYRTVLELFYLGDLSYKEISSVLRIPVGTVMSRLSRGKEQLRHAVSDSSGATLSVTFFSSETTESETKLRSVSSGPSSGKPASVIAPTVIPFQHWPGSSIGASSHQVLLSALFASRV